LLTNEEGIVWFTYGFIGLEIMLGLLKLMLFPQVADEEAAAMEECHGRECVLVFCAATYFIAWYCDICLSADGWVASTPVAV